MKVAIQGQAASYHHLAAKQFFGDDVDILPCDTFKTVFSAVDKNTAKYAVIAIENSLYGSINPVYDLLLKKRFWISGEIYLRIKHCLIGLPGTDKKNIREIYSQIMALAQCEVYLDENFPHAKHIEHHDTVASVELVKKLGDKTKAAIASEGSAKLHNMEILEKEIEDNKQNFTRFLVLEKGTNSVMGANKTSLALITPHSPGALYRALGVFDKHNINLSKLQSRPIKETAWRYMFYIDVEAGLDNDKLKKALADLKTQECEIILLGCYKSSNY
ncbi:MAG TPA: prephenate dehydratase [Candidatus Saccharibacteria bacterium]|nr:prephenate dehydratase [Candidatus Saccharibacteria bacterium]